MKKNNKILTIEEKKFWIIGIILSLLASIYPSICIATLLVTDIDMYLTNVHFFDLVQWAFFSSFITFFLFVAIFILLCKWKGYKGR